MQIWEPFSFFKMRKDVQVLLFSFEAVVARALLENNSAEQSQDFVTEGAAIVKIHLCSA